MKRIITTVILAATMLSSLSFAQRGMRGGAMWNYDLSLTQEQQETIAGLRSEFQKNRIDDQATLQKLRLEQRELLRADNPNQKAINQTMDRIKETEAQMERSWVTHQLAVRNTLNEEQRAIFDNRPMGRGMGMGYGRGMGNCGGLGGPGGRYGRR